MRILTHVVRINFVVVAGIALLLAGEAQAIEMPLFGTNAAVGAAGSEIISTIFTTPPPLNLATLAEEELADDRGEASAFATASGSSFNLGARARDLAIDTFNPAARARMATNYTLFTAEPSPQPELLEMSAFLTGSFDGLVGANLGSVLLTINQFDPAGGFPLLTLQPGSIFRRNLAFLQIDTSLTPFNTTVSVFNPFPPFDPNFIFMDFNWPESGQFSFAFQVDALTGNPLLDVELIAFADASSSAFVTTNFRASLTIVANPAPGTTVTFDTGQVFTGDGPVVPEPSTLLLLGSGLAGLGFFRWRRKAA